MSASVQPFGALPDDRLKGFALALGLHAALFAAGGLGLAGKIEYGVSAGGGADVDLVAAAAPLASAAVAASETLTAPPPAIEEDPIPAPTAASAAAVPAAGHPNAVLRAAGGAGDGSSAAAGKDATTRAGGGDGEALKLPGYFLNPPPPYPVQARAEKQQGVVLLAVLVDARGRVASLSVKISSGFPLLDAAALAGVKNWRFKAARLAGLPVEAAVDIPIRFQLK
jgi:periplasmic protein TonB